MTNVCCVDRGNAGISNLVSRNNCEVRRESEYMCFISCIFVYARAPACVARCSAMSLAPGCVCTLKSFLLSRCAYKTAPDDGALVIKA